jgi:hypothetical protein
MIYLATPYTTDDPDLLEKRYLIAMDIAQFYLKQSIPIFSPILHCHEMSKRYNLPGDIGFWKGYDFQMVLASTEVWFGLLPGFSESIGMKYEFSLAKKQNKPTKIIVPEKDSNWGNGKYTVSSVFLESISGDF